MNYTKGNWEVYDGHDHKLGETLVLAPNPITNKADYVIAKVSDIWPNHTETESNAKLIAAAPALYEALKAYQQANELHNDADSELFDQAEKALAEAEP